MNSILDKQTIEKKLIKILRDILQDNTAEVDPEKSLMLEYGLDSLDLLDLSFNIEEMFGVQIGPDELRGKADTKIAKADMIDENGNISQKALEELKKNIPEISAKEFAYGLRPEAIPSLLNTKVFARIVFEKLHEEE